MQIQEILDSTRAWEHLRGNDVDEIFTVVHAEYIKFSQLIESAEVLHDLVNATQWQQLRIQLQQDFLALETMIKQYISLLGEYPTDEDLNHKIDVCRELMAKLDEMINSLP